MADRYKRLHLAHHGPWQAPKPYPRYRRAKRRAERESAWRAAKRSAKAQMDREDFDES